MYAQPLSDQAIQVLFTSRHLVRYLEDVPIRGDELRDHARLAAESAFIDLCTALPDDRAERRRATIGRARTAVHHLLAIVELARSTDELEDDAASQLERLGESVDGMLAALQRR